MEDDFVLITHGDLTERPSAEPAALSETAHGHPLQASQGLKRKRSVELEDGSGQAELVSAIRKAGRATCRVSHDRPLSTKPAYGDSKVIKGTQSAYNA